MYVTYADLIQIGILIVAFANLIYQICREKEIAATTANSDGLPITKACR